MLTSFEAGAVADCVEDIGDSVGELQDSLRELDLINYNIFSFCFWFQQPDATSEYNI